MCGRPFVLALAGGSASGKSTLTAALLEEMARQLPTIQVESLSMDTFMRRTDPTAPQVVVDGNEVFNANHPDSTDNAAVLAHLKRSRADLVLLEGLMPLALREIRERANLRVFIELDADIRAVRRMERDIRTKRGGGDPASIMSYYIACARVGHELFVQPSSRFADVIVRGDAAPNISARLLCDLIERRI